MLRLSPGSKKKKNSNKKRDREGRRGSEKDAVGRGAGWLSRACEGVREGAREREKEEGVTEAQEKKGDEGRYKWTGPVVSDPSSETGVRRVEFVDSPVFSPRRKSLADAIDCTYVCTTPLGHLSVSERWRNRGSMPARMKGVVKKHGMIGDVSLCC